MTQFSQAFGNEVEDEPVVKISKSKKKRNRRKAKGAAAAAAAAAATPAAGETEMNSMERAIASVVARGYARADVSAAIEEMWDRNLAYDNPKAVVKYLGVSCARNTQ